MSALKDFGKRLVNRTGFDIRKLQPAVTSSTMSPGSSAARTMAPSG
jgi:hypothetical protein